jgi:acetylglutamate kinase
MNHTDYDLTVIKIGGAVLDGDLGLLWAGIRAMTSEGRVVLVHGGGPQSTRLARRLGHEPVLIEGRRVTTDMDLEIVKMVLGGTLNVDLTASALRAGLPAVGLAGISGGTVRVVKRPPWKVGEREVDFGHVGDVVSIDTTVVDALLAAGTLPVVACMGVNDIGGVFNVNADTVAAELAASLPARRLLLITESGGIRDAGGGPVHRLSVSQCRAGVSEGWIRDGMIVKVYTATRAIEAGVREVRIAGVGGVLDAESGTTIFEDSHA